MKIDEKKVDKTIKKNMEINKNQIKEYDIKMGINNNSLLNKKCNIY